MTIWLHLANFATIETESLLLRPFIMRDATGFYQIVSDPDNLSFIFPVRANQQEAKELMVEMFMKTPLGKWAIEEKQTQQLVGAISFEKIDEFTGQAELGYFIHRQHRGKGFAREAVESVSFLGLMEFGLTDICIVAHQENQASQRVAEKAGFQLLRQYKGSDRYTHKMREYKQYHLTRPLLKIFRAEREKNDYH